MIRVFKHRSVWSQPEHKFSVLTSDGDLGLAELAAGLVGGLAQVVTSIFPGGRADLQGRRPICEADPGVTSRSQLLPVLHPLDRQRGGATNVTLKTQLVALIQSQRLQRDVEDRRLLGLCRSDDNHLVHNGAGTGLELTSLSCKQ